MAKWLVGRVHWLLATLWPPGNEWRFISTFKRALTSLDDDASNASTASEMINV